jgi:peroxiredoxin
MKTEKLHMRTALGVILGVAALSCTREAAAPEPATVQPADPALDDALVGTVPPAWTTEEWLHSPPLTLGGLHGRVVLVRWFMGTSCPMCSATAPSLNAFHRDYASKGLTVVGMYHHKEEAPLKPGEYAAFATSFGFEFPVAQDPKWTTLRSWWLDGHERNFTSVSFLLDRQGRVRGIHQGGRYAQGDADYEAMKRGIEKLLAER